MIVSYITGGLGNQLFNYAAARSLADRNSTGLILDATEFRGSPASRQFMLENFPTIRAKFRNTGNYVTKRPPLSRIWRRIREDTLSKNVSRKYETVSYFPEFERLGLNTVLKGHYIDRQFFEWNESRILEDLSLPDDFLEGNDDKRGLEVLDSIKKGGNSVSIHVRRGDFLEPYASWLLLPEIENYYLKAMNYISEKIGRNANFWVFSDDMQWCTKAFKDFSSNLHYVDNFVDSNVNPMREFFLMGKCHHNIIANSGFSLWAALLNSSKTKIVTAPNRWDSLGKTNMINMIPESWIRLEW